MGEKLASVNVYFIVAGPLHQTKGQLMKLPDEPESFDLDPATDIGSGIRSNRFKLVFA